MNEDMTEVEARFRRDPGLQQEWIRQNSLIYGGLIAGCIALMQPFVTATKLDLSAIIAVTSFSVAIPLLAALLMVSQHEGFRHRAAEMRLLTITKIVGQGLAVLGVAAAFWHVLWIAGVAILVTGLAAATIHATAFIRLEQPAAPPERV
jgi:hypothetical protein